MFFWLGYVLRTLTLARALKVKEAVMEPFTPSSSILWHG